ncbi:hypothetical protein [Aquabacterium sp. J223]|uniref:hypothetical protein n=1 Tax=Aquabacterium sp. J223 TaxID=2898431 RepID=UPI0021ADDA23|nr:hypothetical protein [Aquabacterium sp. J223]UUX94289.1 hypothetical protein LRS07_13220 [Aquabacterium sp. J223]
MADSTHVIAADPFALMLDPDAVLRAIEGSVRLERLQRRICRPLDRMPAEGPAQGDARDADDDEA